MRLRSAAIVVVSVVAIAGCDGGPGFFAHAIVTNGCDTAIAVQLDDDPTGGGGHRAGKEVAPAHIVAPGGSRVFETAILTPVGDVIYIWVEPAEASEYGLPLILSTSHFVATVNDEGYDTYAIELSGERCPT